MSPNGNDHQEERFPPDTRPFLSIPYWMAPLPTGGTWDTGTVRPLPGTIVSYACDSIHAGPFMPGQPLDVGVDVLNSGGGNSTAIATVVVYWADPTVGFAKPKFFAATVVAVPPSRRAPASVATATMTATIPADAPAHVCLLAVVSHPQDRAGAACDPVNDRHWAQRNLQAVAVAPGAPALIPFTVANPFATEGTFSLVVGPADERHLFRLAEEFDTEAFQVRAFLRLLDESGAEVSEPGPHVRLPIRFGPLEERRFGVLVEIDQEIPAGTSTGIEVLLVVSAEGERIVGSLGVALVGQR